MAEKRAKPARTRALGVPRAILRRASLVPAAARPGPPLPHGGGPRVSPATARCQDGGRGRAGRRLGRWGGGKSAEDGGGRGRGRSRRRAGGLYGGAAAEAAHTWPLLPRAAGAAGARAAPGTGTGTGMGVHVETIAPGDGETLPALPSLSPFPTGSVPVPVPVPMPVAVPVG